jgi:hypothetical protein
MTQRCRNQNHPRFPAYGGRGIAVCERWSSFGSFLADMGERPCGTSLDRIDGAAGYSPGNCRWASAHEQQSNLKNNRMVEYDGETIHLSALARRFGIDHKTLAYRIAAGWPEAMWGASAWQGNRIAKVK